MSIDRPDWIDTPGLSYLLNVLVPEAAASLISRDRYYPVLLRGPTGTGKTYIKDRILFAAGVPLKKSIHVNCAAIPRDLVESELFGHKIGAFTGALTNSKGLVGSDQVKVLVLDEIGALPKQVQAKLLVFLDSGEYRRVGSNVTERTEANIIGITNSDSEKQFRPDFLQRFNSVSVPGLHARRIDVLYLLEAFAPGIPWTPVDLVRILTYHWPGNVRELTRFALSTSYAWNKDDVPKPIDHGGVLRYTQELRPRARGGDAPQTPAAGPDYLTFLRFREKLMNCIWHADQTGRSSFSKIDPTFRNVMKRHCALLDPSERIMTVYLNTMLGLDAGANENEKKDRTVMSRTDYVEFWNDVWSFFCGMFRQNERLNQDLLKNIVNGDPTRFDEGFPDVPTGPDEVILDWLNIKRRVNEAFYGDNSEEATSGPLASSATTDVAANESESLRAHLRAVLDSMTPAEYKRKWIEYCLDLGPAKTARRYNLSSKTVGGWFRKFKKSKGSEASNQAVNPDQSQEDFF